MELLGLEFTVREAYRTQILGTFVHTHIFFYWSQFAESLGPSYVVMFFVPILFFDYHTLHLQVTKRHPNAELCSLCNILSIERTSSG